MEPAGWTRDPDELMLEPHASAPWEGPHVEGSAYSLGIYEQAVAPTAGGDWVCIYTGEQIEVGTPWFGGSLKRRLGRAVAIGSPLAAFSRDPVAGASSWVFDPRTDGALPGQVIGETNDDAVWGTGYPPLQPSIVRDPRPGGYLHGFWLNVKPSTLIGQQNETWAIGHYWSPDDGLTWVADVNNPLIRKEHLPWSPELFTSANFFNSPNAFFDLTPMPGAPNGKLYLAWCSGPNGVYNSGTKMLMVECAL
jgi:hypothetical protein